MTTAPLPSRARAALAPAAFAAVLMTLAGTAIAHEVGLSRGTYSAAGDHLTAELVLSRKETASVVPGLDADADGKLSPAELTAASASLKTSLVDRIHVTSAGSPCPGALDEATLSEEDGLSVRATYTCPAPVASATIDLALLDDLAFGHRHIARTAAGTHVTEAVMSRSHRTLEVVASSPGGPPPPPKHDYLAMLGLGVEHILTGYDHLVFLLGLVLVGGRWRSLLWVVTAFTLAHSITLAMAALGVWAPRPSIIEPAIALSIAYVGVENFFVKDAEKRWRITFPFGLIHGFGFAGALQEVALPKADVPAALFLFNAGVELGQVAVLAVVLPVLALARKRPWFEKRGVQVGSALIVVAGLAWFFTRVFGGK
ncbi:MAG: HupE/UreJ family protein [Polyangiaceae bacterium]